MSSRFAPLSYEKPKGLLVVKGEVLIERQIRQLQEAGIHDIMVVVGYMKEMFFYLEDKFNVRIVVNEDFFKYNNTSSLIRVLDYLEDTYICCSDNYLVENVFLEKPREAYYSCSYSKGKTEEWCVSEDEEGYINQVTVGGSDSWYMAAHVFFSKDFSANFKEILLREYVKEETKLNLWESLFMKHLDVLKMRVKRYQDGILKEFDSLDELRVFDSAYFCNTNSRIIHNICDILSCKEENIKDIHAIKQGLTNTSFYFSVEIEGKIEKYVYRHPGIGTEEYINRDSEVFSMSVAKELGLDDTFIYMSPEGWKISRYIENAHTLDYHNDEEVNRALFMARTLHNANIHSEYDFHIWDKSKEFVEMIREKGRADFDDFDDLFNQIENLYDFTKEDGVSDCLCHCDFYDPNFLIGQDGKMYLIDWEYSGNDDPASDLGTFICCSDYSFDQCEDIFRRYLGRDANETEKRHYYAYVSLAGYYWYVWAIYQTSVGNNVGEYLYIWYKWAKKACHKAMSMYIKK